MTYPLPQRMHTSYQYAKYNVEENGTCLNIIGMPDGALFRYLTMMYIKWLGTEYAMSEFLEHMYVLQPGRYKSIYFYHQSKIPTLNHNYVCFLSGEETNTRWLDINPMPQPSRVWQLSTLNRNAFRFIIPWVLHMSTVYSKRNPNLKGLTWDAFYRRKHSTSVILFNRFEQVNS